MMELVAETLRCAKLQLNHYHQNINSQFFLQQLLLLLSQQRPNPAGERLTLSVLPSLPWANLFAMMALGFCESKQGCGITRARELKLQTEKAESVLCSIEPVFWRSCLWTRLIYNFMTMSFFSMKSGTYVKSTYFHEMCDFPRISSHLLSFVKTLKFYDAF